MSFKRFSSFVLCLVLVFASVTVASANPLEPPVSPLQDTWRIISGTGQMAGATGSFHSAHRDIDITVEERAFGDGFDIRLNDSGLFFFDAIAQGHISPQPMWGGFDFVRQSTGLYTSTGSRDLRFEVQGNFLYYEEMISPTNFTRLRLQRVSTITGGGGGGTGNGGGGTGGTGGGGGGGGGGCNVTAGLFAMLLALPLVFRKKK